MNAFTLSKYQEFNIVYSFFDDMHETELSMNVNGVNILAFDRNGASLTTRWNRDFDSEDEDEFDAYYDKLDEWNLRHRWHPACAGAILADVCFQLVGEVVEISWNNEDIGDGIRFQNILGGARINKDIFYATVDAFLKEYATHWLT